MYVRLGRYASEEDDLETFERDEDIVIHPYDTWSMDHTLALLIVPMLKQLKETKHGAPNVDTSDVPLFLKPTQLETVRYKEDGTTDKNFFKRWDYVMDEMIWAFEQMMTTKNSSTVENTTSSGFPSTKMVTKLMKRMHTITEWIEVQTTPSR